MKYTTKKYINYIITILSSILYIFIMFKLDVILGTGRKELENILILAIPCFMLLVYSLKLKDKKERKQILIFYLMFYTLALLGFTFANFRNSELITEGIMKTGYNLIPFHTITVLFTSSLGFKTALYNIIGNFLMLTPLSILLPLINNKFKRITNFLITIIIVCLSIELTQYITRIGNLDVDDIILNVSGSLMIYIIIVKTKLYYIIYKIFYEYTISTKTQNIIYYTLLILNVLVYIWYTVLIYNHTKKNEIDYANISCIIENKTYLSTTTNITKD